MREALINKENWAGLITTEEAINLSFACQLAYISILLMILRTQFDVGWKQFVMDQMKPLLSLKRYTQPVTLVARCNWIKEYTIELLAMEYDYAYIVSSVNASLEPTVACRYHRNLRPMDHIQGPRHTKTPKLCSGYQYSPNWRVRRVLGCVGSASPNVADANMNMGGWWWVNGCRISYSRHFPSNNHANWEGDRCWFDEQPSCRSRKSYGSSNSHHLRLPVLPWAILFAVTSKEEQEVPALSRNT